MYKIVYVALYTALVIVVHAMLNIKKYVVRKTFSSFPFPNQEDSAFSLSNKKAPLSSQKTLNKQDEVIGTTACPALMRMAPLIGLQLTQLLPAPLFFFHFNQFSQNIYLMLCTICRKNNTAKGFTLSLCLLINLQAFVFDFLILCLLMQIKYLF